MKELIFIETTTNLEFMININCRTHKVIDCYTYIKDIKSKKDEFWEIKELTAVRWKTDQNALFGHNKYAFKIIALYCVFIPKDEKEWNFAHNVMAANNITQFEILEP